MNTAHFAGAIPSAGALLGTTVSDDLLTSLNQNLNLGSDFFGSIEDVFHKSRKLVNTVIQPIRDTAIKLRHVTAKLVKQDKIIPYTEFNDFNYVPPSMELPILMYKPVYDLFQEGRVAGFDKYDPDNLPEEDVYGRLINNGYVEDVFGVVKDKQYTTVYEFDSEDPDLSFEELDWINETRAAIERMLDETDKDPTCYPRRRG